MGVKVFAYAGAKPMNVIIQYVIKVCPYQRHKECVSKHNGATTFNVLNSVLLKPGACLQAANMFLQTHFHHILSSTLLFITPHSILMTWKQKYLQTETH